MSGFNQGADNVSKALYRRPYLQDRANAAQSRDMVAMSQFGLNNARTQELTQKGALVEALQKTAPLAQKALLEGRYDDPSVDQFTGAVSALTGQNKDDVQKSMKQGIGTILALQGKTPMAAAVENPVSVHNNQVNAEERAGRPIALHDDSQLVTPEGGVLATSLQKLGPGQRLLSTGGNPNLETVGEGAAQPPKSSETEAILNRAIAGVIANEKMDDKTKNFTINALRANIKTGETAPAKDAAKPTPPEAESGAPAQVPTFADESSARAGGAKSGDIIYLQGVGKVRLR